MIYKVKMEANHAWAGRSKRSTLPYTCLTLPTACFSIHVCDFVYKCLKFLTASDENIYLRSLWTNCIGRIISRADNDRMPIMASRYLISCPISSQMHMSGFVRICNYALWWIFHVQSAPPSPQPTGTILNYQHVTCMCFNSTICVNFDCYLQKTFKWLNIPFPCSAILHLYRSGEALFVCFYINLPTGGHRLKSSLALILYTEPKINYLLSSASKQPHSLANLHLRVIEWTTQWEIICSSFNCGLFLKWVLFT